MRVMGIDEAGRGAIIGPMSIGAVVVEDDSVLRSLGVRDSKELTPQKREELSAKIKEISESDVIFFQAGEIDALMANGVNLNRIELMGFARHINTMKPDKVIIDAPQVDTGKFALFVRSLLDYEPELVCENKADKNHPTVAAASIIAKVERDKAVKEIERTHGINVGVGYTHDADCIAFLNEYFKKYKDFPVYVRQSWITAKRIREKRSQSGLGSFFNP